MEITGEIIDKMKQIKLFLTILFLIICLVGCNSSSNDMLYNENSVMSNENYEIYSMLPPEKREFNKMVSDNPIDQEYQAEFSKVTTTQEFVELENKYTGLWKKEMNSNLSELIDVLDEHEAEIVLESQEAWENSVIICANADKNVIDETLGTSFNWMWQSNIREEYRNRAIHLSYLHYLIVNQTNY
ncbi:MAG: hypothetical protein IJB57_00835 [Clostridia bacterium]|nr:hypothetical protein [Clostridia bacterium]